MPGMRAKTPKTNSEWEDLLAKHIKYLSLPAPEREYAFIKGRRFRADFAWPEQRLLVEVEGGIWANGRHTRGKGYEIDCEKYNLAALNGFTVLRYTPKMVGSGIAVNDIKFYLENTCQGN